MMTPIPDSLRCEPHPILPSLTEEQVRVWLGKPGGAKSYAEWLAKRRRQAALWDPEAPEADLFYTAYIPQAWRDATAQLAESNLLAVFGGNGSAKTWFAAWLGMHTLVAKPNTKVLWLHEAEKASIDVQQPAVQHFLPKAWRGGKRGAVHNTDYSIKNGFAGGRFVLPNRSVGVFGYYGQQVKDYEGGGWNLVLADENLPLYWLETLMYRLPRRQGKFIWTFTPIRGITPAIRELVQGARTVKQRPAELLPADKRVPKTGCEPGHMPYIQQGLRYDARIMYFFTEDNPFSGYAQQKRQAAGATLEEIERRFYGWARDTKGAMFPGFGVHNIIDPEAVPAKGTNYLVVDPAFDRNWFMLWIRCARDGRYYVYREWPDMATYGEWAVPTERSPSDGGKGWDGDPGPAQLKLGYGYAEYQETIMNAERRTDKEKEKDGGAEKIFRRFFDPRAAGTEILTDTGGTNLIYELAKARVGSNGEKMPGLDFEQALKVRDEDPVALIDSAVRINPDSPLDPLMNWPRLLVSKACGNLIWALQNFTGRDGQKGACKDPVDCLKYFMTVDAQAGEDELKSLGGGSY